MHHIDKNASCAFHLGGLAALLAVVVLAAAFSTALAASDDDHHHHTTFAFVAASAASNLYMIDITTNKAVAQIPRDGPLQSVTTPDGKITYSLNSTENEVLMLDGDKDDPDHIRVGKGPSGLALSLDGTKLFVFNSIDKTISVIDTGEERVEEVDPAPTLNFGIHVSPDGHLTAVD